MNRTYCRPYHYAFQTQSVRSLKIVEVHVVLPRFVLVGEAKSNTTDGLGELYWILNGLDQNGETISMQWITVGLILTWSIGFCMHSFWQLVFWLEARTKQSNTTQNRNTNRKKTNQPIMSTFWPKKQKQAEHMTTTPFNSSTPQSLESAVPGWSSRRQWWQKPHRRSWRQSNKWCSCRRTLHSVFSLGKLRWKKCGLV